MKNLKQQLYKKTQECESLQRENELMNKLVQRCEKLEKDTEIWMNERDVLTAKFKTDLEYEKAKFANELELTVASLNH